MTFYKVLEDVGSFLFIGLLFTHQVLFTFILNLKKNILLLMPNKYILHIIIIEYELSKY